MTLFLCSVSRVFIKFLVNMVSVTLVKLKQPSNFVQRIHQLSTQDISRILIAKYSWNAIHTVVCSSVSCMVKPGSNPRQGMDVLSLLGVTMIVDCVLLHKWPHQFRWPTRTYPPRQIEQVLCHWKESILGILGPFFSFLMLRFCL